MLNVHIIIVRAKDLTFQDTSQNDAAELESQGSCSLWHDQKRKGLETAAVAPGSRNVPPSA